MASVDAFSYSLKLLSLCPRSKSHLALLLKKKGFKSLDVDEAVNRLEKLNLLNDRLFAAQATEQLLAHQPSGKKRIWTMLRKKKVSPEIAREVLGNINAESEKARARELAEWHEAKWMNLPELKRKKKIYDLLVRRGFDFELCREAIEKVR